MNFHDTYLDTCRPALAKRREVGLETALFRSRRLSIPAFDPSDTARCAVCIEAR